MSKYSDLRDYLLSKRGGSWVASFLEIENVLGFALPASARKYPAWWANQKNSGSVQCSAWLDAGWETENVNLASERVTFVKVGSASYDGNFQKSHSDRSQMTSEGSPIVGHAASDTSFQILYNWEVVGKAFIGRRNKLDFPSVASGQAVYRLKLSNRGASAYYFGETQDISRRLNNYRNPGPSQKTSIRLNRLMSECLESGGSVSVSTVRSAVAKNGNTPIKLNLQGKYERRLLEAVAVTQAQLDKLSILNL